MIAQDGSLSKYQALTYGLQLDQRVMPGPEVFDKMEHDQRKAKADADMAEMKAEKMRRETDKLWLHADEAWAAVAGLVGGLRDCIRHHLYIGQVGVVEAADGEQVRSQEVFEHMDSLVDKDFNEVAGASIDIKFEKEPG